MSHRLQQLLDLYRTNKLTEDQHGELASLLENDEAAEQFAHLIGQQLSGGEWSLAGDLLTTEDRIVQGIIKKIQPAPVVPVRHTGFFRKWGWAAAAIVIIGAATYFLLVNTNVRPSLAGDNRYAQNDIGPGGDKAVLTLSDGTTIGLDSAGNGAIAQQGNVSIVKLANGRISYQLTSTAAGAAMMNTMRTPRGGQYQLTLPDGTQVWLNAASSITYPTVFAEKERQVKISGEVYFEVAKNREKPFIATVEGLSSVEVLGTRFNVNSYINEGPVKTTLLEGSVKVRSMAPGSGLPGTPPPATILTPRQQAQVSGQRLSVADNADIDKVMAWKNGLFNFNDASLEEVMRQLARWYDVEVVYEKGIPDIRFEGEISRNMKLSDLLKVLARAEVKFRMEGRRLVVLP